MKEKYYKIITFIIILITLTFSLTLIFSKKVTFSENENRYLATFPKFTFNNLISGKYIENLESYLQDHFPLRDSLLSYKTAFFRFIGQNKINGIYVGDKYLIEEYTKDDNKDKIINTINKFSSNDQINYSFLLAPTSYETYSEYLPKNHLGINELDTIKYYREHLNIPLIDVSKTFNDNKDKYQLYYQTDHHWTSYGAYLAYQEYCKLNNLPYHDISEFTVKEVSDKFYGTLYSKTIPFNQIPDKIHRFDLASSSFNVNYGTYQSDSLYNDTYLNKKDKYSYFLDNNHPLIKITNNNIHDGSNLLIIKDSYANSLIPFLANDYEKIYVIDPRYYSASISEYIEDNNIENVLFIYNVLNINDDLGIITIR